MFEKNPETLCLEEIEKIEMMTLRWLFQAVYDFGMEAYEVFLCSPDNVKDIAEDITRELLDRLSGFNVQQRVYGTVDYKKARYVIVPEETVRQVLFIDLKLRKKIDQQQFRCLKPHYVSDKIGRAQRRVKKVACLR